jgi:uncharacterized membrane protein
VPKPPAWLPGQSALAYLTGVGLVALGLAILSGRFVRSVGTILSVALGLSFLLLYLPSMTVYADPRIDHPFFRGFMWTNPLKCLALVGGMALLAARLGEEPRRLLPVREGVGRLARFGASMLAAFLIVCGVQHFVYAPFVATLVPSWIPPGQEFWTYFCGGALIAGGAGIVIPRTARLAGSLSALMIFLWVLLLHIPRALAGPNHANETAGVFEALALSGVALLVAATRPSPHSAIGIEIAAGNKRPRPT